MWHCLQNGRKEPHKVYEGLKSSVSQPTILKWLIYRVSTNKLYIFNMTHITRTSYLHQPTENISKFYTNLTDTRCGFRESHGRCLDDNPTRPKLRAVCPYRWESWPLLLEFLARSVNQYSGEWFHEVHKINSQQRSRVCPSTCIFNLRPAFSSVSKVCSKLCRVNFHFDSYRSIQYIKSNSSTL
jgi:hypothetical protein